MKQVSTTIMVTIVHRIIVTIATAPVEMTSNPTCKYENYFVVYIVMCIIL